MKSERPSVSQMLLAGAPETQVSALPNGSKQEPSPVTADQPSAGKRHVSHCCDFTFSDSHKFKQVKGMGESDLNPTLYPFFKYI